MSSRKALEGESSLNNFDSKMEKDKKLGWWSGKSVFSSHKSINIVICVEVRKRLKETGWKKLDKHNSKVFSRSDMREDQKKNRKHTQEKILF